MSQEETDFLLNTLNVIAIQLSRIYDVQMAALPPQIREKVEEVHEQGQFIGTPPIVSEDPYSDPIG